ncbi:MAG: MTH1187 family thiamine-binding protein [Thermoplasmatota archaeon]
MSYIAFLVVSPMDRGPSLSGYVRAAVDAIDSSGLKYQVTPMGTIIESEDIDAILAVTRDAVEAVRSLNSDRISVTLKIDARYDRDITMESKMRSLDR